MENPIFQRLQAMLEYPCRSKEWFPLAEQVLNTVYALGDHPDALCNALIKNLTRRAFTPRSKATAPTDSQQVPQTERDPDAMQEEDETNQGEMEVDGEQADRSFASSQSGPPSGSQDTGDAFELSKLLFVVGHVAIKHIAYLELVEREWKRQKDEKQAGQLMRQAFPNC
jgi:condensin complex subunit 1